MQNMKHIKWIIRQVPVRQFLIWVFLIEGAILQNSLQVFLMEEPRQENNVQNKVVDPAANEPPRKDSVQSEQKNQEDLQRFQQRKKEDAKSIFIQNVDYKSTRQELQLIFDDCGTISRITIVKDPFTKQPKGCAYLSFESQEDVDMALNISGTKLRGRTIKVQRKRTNIVGMNKKTQGQRSMLFLNQMMLKLTSQTGFRGKPRGRGR